jgi:VWFA-related protein
VNRFPLLFSAFAIAFAQNPAQPPVPAAGAVPGASIRIDVNLVQVDAVVTDSKDRRVTNLPVSDFEIRQDGKPQAITNFSYVSTKPAEGGTARAHPAAQAKLAKGEVPPPPERLRPAAVRRTLAIVVDDLGLSGESIPPVRNAIRDFLDNQMRPGDLPAIIRTGAGMGALQQFTTDKRLLYAALDRIRYGESRVGLASITPLGSGLRGGPSAAIVERLRQEALTAGTLDSLRFVVNSMQGLPGRKSVLLFTENLHLIAGGSTDPTVAAALQRLTDAASRALVVIHSINPRGVPVYSVTAADNAGTSPRRISRVPMRRQAEVIRSEEGMSALADQTGGLLLHETNDLAGALREAAEDSDGYYLIGYHPDAETFEDAKGKAKFHTISVKVNQAGLHVRSRDGFFGEPGGNQPPAHQREAELVHALQSPFIPGPIHPRLTAVFSDLPQTGSFINASLYFNPNELKWSREPDGSHQASLDVAAAAYDQNGATLAPVDTTFTLRLQSPAFDEALRNGMVYDIHVPIARPGPYLVRAAVRDAATEGAGSDQQYVEVPDVTNGRLALSGIALQEAGAPAADDPLSSLAPRRPAPGVNFAGGAAQRSFRRGERLVYSYGIINARSGADLRPDLEAQVRLFHDGELTLTAQTTLAAAAGAPGEQRLRAGGSLSLGRDIAPGEYVLQLVVTDKLAKGKFAVASQSMDFEIEP